jgi:hypothetical protein
MAQCGMLVSALLALLVLAAGSATASSAEAGSIILKMAAADGFSVQSGGGAGATAPGEPIGRNLRRVRLQPGADVQQELAHLSAMEGECWVVFVLLLLHLTHCAPHLPLRRRCCRSSRTDVSVFPLLLQVWSTQCPTCRSTLQP